MGSRNFPKATKMGSIFGHGIDLDLCSAYFSGPSAMGRMQNARRMIGDRAPFPRYHAQSAKRKNSARDA